MTHQHLSKSDNVEVTRTVARFGATSYQIANIGSLQIITTRKTRGMAILCILLGVTCPRIFGPRIA